MMIKETQREGSIKKKLQETDENHKKKKSVDLRMKKKEKRKIIVTGIWA